MVYTYLPWRPIYCTRISVSVPIFPCPESPDQSQSHSHTSMCRISRTNQSHSHVPMSRSISVPFPCFHVQDLQIKQGATQPMYLQTDIKSFDLSSLGVKYDVILIDPPLEEYHRKASGVNFGWEPWDWEEVRV